MKSMIRLLLVLVALAPVASRAADQLTEITARAAETEREERLKRVEALLQTLQETADSLQRQQQSLKKRIEEIEDQVRASKTTHDLAAAGFQKQLDYYGEKLKEIDAKRLMDTRLILTNIAELAKLPIAQKSPSNPETPSSAGEASAVYVVKKNDRLSDIIANHNRKLRPGQAKLTMEQLLRANPGLNPNLLLPGQKILVPDTVMGTGY